MSTVSSYDNLGRLTSTVGNGPAVTNTWDALSRPQSIDDGGGDHGLRL